YSGSTSMLTDKIALVTGASHGIGKAIALCLADAGADIAFSYRGNSEGADATVKLIEAKGRRVHFVHAELSDPAQATSLAQEAIDTLGGVDILANNAGGSYAGELASLPLESWRYAFDLNVTAALVASQVVVRHMVQHGKPGSVINISSVHSSHVWANRAAY